MIITMRRTVPSEEAAIVLDSWFLFCFWVLLYSTCYSAVTVDQFPLHHFTDWWKSPGLYKSFEKIPLSLKMLPTKSCSRNFMQMFLSSQRKKAAVHRTVALTGASWTALAFPGIASTSTRAAWAAPGEPSVSVWAAAATASEMLLASVGAVSASAGTASALRFVVVASAGRHKPSFLHSRVMDPAPRYTPKGIAASPAGC